MTDVQKHRATVIEAFIQYLSEDFEIRLHIMVLYSLSVVTTAVSFIIDDLHQRIC